MAFHNVLNCDLGSLLKLSDHPPPYPFQFRRYQNYKYNNYVIWQRCVRLPAFPSCPTMFRFVPRTAVLTRVSIARSTNFQGTSIPRAFYSAGGGGLTRDVITSRILETLKGYEKIDPAKVRIHTFNLDKD